MAKKPGRRKADQNCSTKQWITTTLGAFVIASAYDWLVHGNILMGMYEATASLWRDPKEMQTLFPYMIAKHALEALVFTTLYFTWKCSQSFGELFSEDCPVRKGFLFGATVGLLLGINTAASYIWTPIPQNLALSWLVAETVKWGLVGGILSYFCCSCKKGK